MNRYELIYDAENNEGVFGVSIVNAPAVKHIAVQLSEDSKECKCEFSEDVEDGVYLALSELIDKGESLDNLGEWEVIDAVPVSELSSFSFADEIQTNEGELSEQDNELFKVRYRLAPNKLSSNSRHFCRMLITANKMYRKEDIEEASRSGVNGSFSAKGQSTYDIFLFKGGVYCQHFWERVILLRTNNDQQITSREARAILNEIEPSERNQYRVPQNDKRVAKPAEASNNYWKMASEEKRVLVQPILIPEQNVYRSNVNGSEGYVFASKETIEKLQQNFFKQNYNHNSSIEHDENKVIDNVYIFESWIVQDSEKDKSNVLGFNLPIGSWVVSMKIENDEIWSKVKNGELKGLSIDAVLASKII